MVFSKFWFENKKSFLLLFGAIAAFFVIWMSFYYSFNTPNLFRPHFQVGYYFVGMCLSGLLSASFLFSDLRSKPRAISYLMIPASQLEKVICTLFFGVLVFWIGYSVVFTGIDWVFVTLSNIRTRRTEEVINILTINKYMNPFLDEPSSILYYIFFSIHALFILGSIYFERFAFFKTLLVFLVLWMAVFFVPMLLYSFMPPGVWMSSLSIYEVYDYHGSFLLKLPLWFSWTMYLYFGFAVTIMLWITAYFRLTEKQIA
jgi:hypothetical protein